MLERQPTSHWILIIRSASSEKQKLWVVQWFAKWPWLHYDTAQDLAFCHTCVIAVASGKLALSTGNIKDSAFISTGFSNWKDATVSFANHTDWTTHTTAVELVLTLPKTTGDVGELLSSAHAAERSQTLSVLLLLLNAFDFLHGRHLHYVEMVMNMIAISCKFFA